MATSATAALKVAEKLIVTSAEFHTTNRYLLMEERPVVKPTKASRHHGYKAIVVLYMGGGADTFNCELENARECLPLVGGFVAVV